MKSLVKAFDNHDSKVCSSIEPHLVLIFVYQASDTKTSYIGKSAELSVQNVYAFIQVVLHCLQNFCVRRVCSGSLINNFKSIRTKNKWQCTRRFKYFICFQTNVTGKYQNFGNILGSFSWRYLKDSSRLLFGYNE